MTLQRAPGGLARRAQAELVGPRADQLDDLGRRGERRTTRERRLGVVLDPSWMPCASSGPAISPASISAMSIPEETPAAVMILPSRTIRSADRRDPVGPQAGRIWSQCVVAPGHQAARRRRAAARRCRPTSSRSSLVGVAHPVEQRLDRAARARVPKPPGHNDHLRLGQLAERPIRDQRKHPVLGPLRPRLLSDEAHARVGQPRQHLIRPDRIKRGDLVEDRDRDVHSPVTA